MAKKVGAACCTKALLVIIILVMLLFKASVFGNIQEFTKSSLLTFRLNCFSQEKKIEQRLQKNPLKFCQKNLQVNFPRN